MRCKNYFLTTCLFLAHNLLCSAASTELPTQKPTAVPSLPPSSIPPSAPSLTPSTNQNQTSVNNAYQPPITSLPTSPIGTPLGSTNIGTAALLITPILSIPSTILAPSIGIPIFAGSLAANYGHKKLCQDNCSDGAKKGQALYEALSKSKDMDDAIRIFISLNDVSHCIMYCNRFDILVHSIHHIDFLDELIANFKPSNNQIIDPVLDHNAIAYLGVVLGLRPDDIGIKRTILHRYLYNRDPRTPIKRENKYTADPRYQQVSSTLRALHCGTLRDSKLIRLGITCPEAGTSPMK